MEATLTASVEWQWQRPPRVIGHRGAPREATENTIASFRAALDAGVLAVELDARVSRDGEVVVHHDAALGRALPGSGLVEELDAATLVAAGAPLLRDVLALPFLVNVEIKADAANADAVPARVLDVVRKVGALDRVLVSSFAPELADEYARLAGTPAAGILPFPPEMADLDAWPRLATLAIAEDAAEPEVLALCRDAGRRVLVWTVNDPAAARRLLDAGADGIITDRPGPMLRALSGTPGGKESQGSQ